MELGKGLLKALILGAALFTIVLETVRSLPLLPACGMPCIGSLIAANATSLLHTGAGISLAAGLADVLIQRWLFLRDMKMSKSEVKKEHKDQEGDPHVRNAHRRHRQEAASLPRTGLDRATILIRGRGVVVGLRYVASEGTAPVIVCRARNERADAMLAAGAELRIPTVVDEWLAVSLAKKVPPGMILPKPLLRPGGAGDLRHHADLTSPGVCVIANWRKRYVIGGSRRDFPGLCGPMCPEGFL